MGQIGNNGKQREIEGLYRMYHTSYDLEYRERSFILVSSSVRDSIKCVKTPGMSMHGLACYAVLTRE